MKRISKLLVTLVFALCIAFSCVSAASAAGLAKVTGLKVSSYTISSVKLTWTSVSSAKKYQIRVYEGSSLKKTITTSDSKAYYTVTGLTPKKSYKFNVRAYNSVLINGSYSSNVSATTGVAKVTNLKATTTPTTAKLTWSKVAGAKAYVVQQKSGSSWKTLAKPTSNSYTVKNLTPGKKVEFRVYAYAVSGSKTYKSSTVSISVTPKVATVSSLKASVLSCSSVKLSWGKVSGATAYVVQQKIGGKWKTLAKPTSNSYTVKNLTPKTKAEFKVYAYTTISKKTYKGSAASVSATPTVAAVSSFTASTSYASATLKWSAATSAKNYQIQYATKSDYSNAKTITIKDTETLKYKLSSLKTGTTYYLRIRAQQTAKVSGKTKTYSSAWKTLKITPALSAVSGVKASSIKTTSTAISWSKVSGASGYQVVYATSSDFKTNKKVVTIKSGSTVTSSISSLATGTKYYVRVRAYRTVDSKNVYGSYSSVVTFATVPAQVKSLAKSAIADNSITVKWTATACAKYIVYYKTSSESSYSSTTVTTNSCKITGLSAATTYNIYVRAVNASSVKGASSSVITLTTTGISGATPTLTIPSSSVTASSVKLTWTSIAGATGYQVQYGLKKNLSDAKTVTVKSGSTLTATVSGLNSYKTYYFKVRAYGVNGSGETVYGTYSSVKNTKTLHAKVTGLKATGSDYSVTLTWNNLSYSSYNVYYKMEGATSYSKVSSTTNSYTLTNLDGSKNYYIYVRAVEDDSEGENSDEVKVKTTGLSMDKPTLKCTYSDSNPTTASFSWTAVPGATKYYLYYSYRTNGANTDTRHFDTTETSFSFPTLKSGAEYTVLVKAVLTNAEGAIVKVGSDSKQAVFATKPDAVKNITAKAGETSIELQWTKTDCYNYYVTYTPAGGKATTFTTQANRYTITGLTTGTTYTVSVTAANTKGVKSTAASVTATTYKGINSVTVNEDGYYTVNFDAIESEDTVAYIQQQYSVENNEWTSAPTTVTDNGDGTLSSTSNFMYNTNSALIRVVAFANSEEIFVSDPYDLITTNGFNVTKDTSKYTVTLSWNDDVAAASKVRVYNIYNNTYTEVTASANDTLTYYVAPGAIHRFAVYSGDTLVASAAVDMPAINTSLTTNEAKAAQINYLVQAINNTKNDTSDYKVTTVSGGGLVYDTTYLKMAVTSTNPLSIFKAMFANELGGDEIECNSAAEIEEKMGKLLGEDVDGSFTNVTEDFDTTSKTFQNTALKTAYIEPFGKDAVWASNQTPADWSKVFSSITTTKQADGTHKVVAVIKKETTSTPCHLNFLSANTLDSSSAINMDEIFGDYGSGNVDVKSVGATTITAVIDSNNHLVSYDISLPSVIAMDMKMDLDLEIETLTIALDMNLDCVTNYEYSFIEETA